MVLIHGYLLLALWVLYFGYWQVKSSNVKQTERREPAASRLYRLVLMIAAMVLIWWPKLPIIPLRRRFVASSEWAFWSGVAVTACGLLFSVWARHYLGSNWSQAVTLKKDHELITGGPYAVVRHPIYLGLILGFLGTGFAQGEWRGLMAVVLVLLALWPKLRREEKWLREQFGEAYESYSRRVAALVPYIL